MPEYKLFKRDHFEKYIYPVGNSLDCVADKPYRINIYDSYIVSVFSSCLRHLPFGRHL